jgi:hypothetical protein
VHVAARFLCIGACVAAALAATGWLVSENRRLLLRTEHLERELAAAVEHGDVADRAVQRLEDELRRAMTERSAVVDAVDDARRELAAARAAQQDAVRKANAPMPEGVRLCLQTLNDLLHADGHVGWRFLRAESAEDRVLRGVELIDYDPRALTTSVYTADRATFVLDRATGSLAMTLTGGAVVGGGADRTLGGLGETVVLDGIDTASWESRLPFLVAAHGTAPSADTATPSPRRVDRRTLAMWRERLDLLFARARTDLRYRVGRLEDLHDQRFVDVAIHGYTDGRALAFSASARELEVRVDQRAGTASLLLRDGVLRRAGGETAIPATGYRFLLPGIDPAAARDILLGLVVVEP